MSERLLTVGELARRAESPDGWRRLARRKLADLDEQIAKARAAREAVEHALRCGRQDILQCPTFGGLVAARLAGRSLQEAHSHAHDRGDAL
ncbi:hypothetical protein [Thermoactinospora rubra]|uniref:hypothetical protein n=1 Tax=Thermoactinospora rubra TaxID=1088767 RepID=UPI000A1152D2|nr:hypothetical protein [Thermoactinospora rubra]